MEIYAIGDREYSVYICTKELVERHIDPERFSAAEAEVLFRETFLGKAYGERMKIELFPGREEMLIFVHIGPSAPRFFTFRDGESLISALEECETDDIEFLTYINSTFYLAVYPFSEECFFGGLEEFGEIFSAPPEFELYLREHGEFFLKHEDIKDLKRLFSAKNRQDLC